jgi:hypothetical protein
MPTLITCHRRTSQRPDEELIKKFKKTFPEVNLNNSMSNGNHTGSIISSAVEGGIPGQYVFRCLSFSYGYFIANS